MGYIDQCPSQIQFYFLEGLLTKNQFTLYKSGKLGTPLVTITASIIGESNVVWLKFPDYTLTEAVVCTGNVNIGKCRLLHAGNLVSKDTPHKDKAFVVENKTHNFLYKFSGKIFPWKKGSLFLKALERAKTGQPKNSLCLSKDFDSGPDGIIPKTIVIVKVRNRQIVIQTVHTYPNKQQIAFSNSSLIINKGGDCLI